MTARNRSTLLRAWCLVALFGACTDDPNVPLGGGGGGNGSGNIPPAAGVRQLAVDDDYLYWLTWNVKPPGGWQGTEPALLTVTRANKDGTDAIELGVAGQRVNESDGIYDMSCVLHVADGDVYFSDTTFIAKARGDGGGVELLVPVVDGGLQGLAMDSATLYYTVPGAIQSIPTIGGITSEITTELFLPRQLAVDSAYLYVVSEFPSPMLHRIGKNGNTLTDLELAPVGYSTPLRVDGSEIYYTTDGVNRKVSKAGGPSTVVVADKIVGEFAADANSVYVIREGATIVKVDKTTYTETTLVQGSPTLPRIVSIAVDDTHVYWSTDEGVISWIAK
jgi:hypothetical protein